MPHPFGTFVPFKEYMAWAHQQGCTFQSSVQIKKGQCLSVTTITAPNGRRLPVVDVSAGESVPVATIRGYDRRLGLQSPFGA